MAGALSPAAYAAGGDDEAGASAPVSYSSSTDEELTELARRWADLGPEERTALITEVKQRMARQGSTSGVLRIRLERRYGTVLRSRNGTTLRIERVQRVISDPAGQSPDAATTPAGESADRPTGPGALTPAQAWFGVGFERRTARQEEGDIRQADPPPAPVLKVNGAGGRSAADH